MSTVCSAYEPSLSAWVDGMLPPGRQVAVAAHLDDCAACRDAVAALRRTRAALRSLPVREVPGGLLDPGSLRRRWVTTGRPVTGRAPVHRRGRVYRWLHGAGTAVALLVALLVVGFVLGAAPPPALSPGAPSVPMEEFASQHLIRTAAGPVTPPVAPVARPTGR